MGWIERPPVPPNAHTSANAQGDAGVPFGMVVPSVYGPIIVNRHDINQTNSLIKTGRAYDHGEIVFLCEFLRSAPHGAVCLDIGANVGLYALELGRALRETQGVCHAFEAQRVFAAMIGGTTALNGIENVIVHHLAIGDRESSIAIPTFDYNSELNFGSVEFGGTQRERLSQSPAEGRAPEMVKQVTIDSLELKGVELVKIDIEGMEELALNGGRRTIERDTPLMLIEWIKSDKVKLVHMCKSFGYDVFEWGSNLLCVHPSKRARYSVRPSWLVL